MKNLSLFDADPTQSASLSDWQEESTDSAGLRYYQREAIEAVKAEFSAGRRSTIIVLATALGKTVCFGALTKEWRAYSKDTHARVLVLAHREELVRQAQEKLSQMTGENVDIEKADRRASLRSRIVVASIQTMQMQKRLERFPKDHFSLVIYDEVHHAVSKTFRRPADYFASAKLLGVTATPDRGDKKALGMLFESVAYVKDISDGIDEGFLVGVEGKEVVIEQVDLSNVGTTKDGDLKQDQLDDAMLKGAEGICAKLFELVPDQHTVLFAPGVKTAHYCAAKLNEYRPGCAAAVDGETPHDERKRVLKDFAEGRLSFISNCAVLTEGFDAPITNVVARANPTKSRSRYAQEIGRGTRVLPGVIEDVQGNGLGDIRKRLIAVSAKTKVLVLDFTGDCGKHSLIGPEDILGGNYTEAEVKQAKKLRKDTGETDVRKTLEQARKELRAMAKAMDAKVRASVHDFNPFDVIKVPDAREHAYRLAHGYSPMSEAQRTALSKMGLSDKELDGKSKHEAALMLKAASDRRKKGLASLKQLQILSKYGVSSANLTAKRASDALDYIKGCGWKSRNIDPNRLNAIVGGNEQRIPGEEGD